MVLLPGCYLALRTLPFDPVLEPYYSREQDIELVVAVVRPLQVVASAVVVRLSVVVHVHQLPPLVCKPLATFEHIHRVLWEDCCR